MTGSQQLTLFIYAFLFIFGGVIVGFLIGFSAGRTARQLELMIEHQEDLGREESVCR